MTLVLVCTVHTVSTREKYSYCMPLYVIMLMTIQSALYVWPQERSEVLELLKKQHEASKDEVTTLLELEQSEELEKLRQVSWDSIHKK